MKGTTLMYTTLGQTSLPVVVAASVGGPLLVAIGGIVVVLAILLVFIMVLRSNGGARKTASGIGFDAQQGPLGQPRAPMSQPDRARAGMRQPGGWGPDGDYGGAANGDWGMPGAGDVTRGQAGWGAPQQPFAGPPPAWGDDPNWGRAPAPGMPAGGPAQNPWDAPAGAPMGGGRDNWGQQPTPQGGWGAPPTTPRSWGAPAGNPGAGPASGGGWGAPHAVAPGGAPDWGMPGAGMGAGAGAAVGGYEVDKTRVVRPAGAQRLATLVVRQGKEPGRSYELRKDRTTIGRSRESDIFLEDLAVSRLHSTINRDEAGRHILRDENSANGTVVNGQRISEHLLQEGDEIQVGQTVLAFVHR
jgi:hypothetical protein